MHTVQYAVHKGTRLHADARTVFITLIFMMRLALSPSLETTIKLISKYTLYEYIQYSTAISYIIPMDGAIII